MKRTEKGQGLVEFAIPVVFVLMLILIFLSLFGGQRFIDFIDATTQISDQMTHQRASGERPSMIKAIQETRKYSDIPRTPHADTSHAEQQWNAETIAAYYDAGYCTPHINECPDEDKDYHICEIKPGKSIALVIGETMEVVITGFMGDTDYWESRCQETP